MAGLNDLDIIGGSINRFWLIGVLLPLFSFPMKRSKHYRACLILLASMGMSVAPLLQLAQAKPAQAEPINHSKQSDSPASTPISAEADRALTEGLDSIRQGDVTAAIASFETAVSLDPSSAAAHYNLGLALRQNNQLQAAASAFWEATQADPEFVLAYVNLGAALLEGDSLDQAEPYLTRALELDPELGLTHFNIGLLRKRQGNLESAFESFRSAIAYSPSAPESHYQIGLLYQQQQQYDQAQIAFQNAIDIDYRYPEAHYNLGVTFIRRNSPETAILAFTRATELQPMFGHAHYAIGLALADLQRYGEAQERLQTAANIYISQGNAQWANNAQSQITQIQNIRAEP